MYFYVVEAILKKLDLEDILEKEMDLWNQTSEINSSNTNIDKLNTSNVQSKISDNLITSKISETIQNIRIKKQKDFYASQMQRIEIKKPKIVSSKTKKEFPELSQQDCMEVVINEDSNEEDIFVNKSRKRGNVSLTLSTSSSMSFTSPSPSLNNSNSTCINEKNSDSHSPSLPASDTRQLAKMKLSAFRFNKNVSSSNSGGVESNTSILPPPHNKLDLSNIFSTGEEDDLSYLDID